jgi:hypothetical protein
MNFIFFSVIEPLFIQKIRTLLAKILNITSKKDIKLYYIGDDAENRESKESGNLGSLGNLGRKESLFFRSFSLKYQTFCFFGD